MWPCPLGRLRICARTRRRAIGRVVRNKGRLGNMALGLLAVLCGGILHCVCVVVGRSLLSRLDLSLSLRHHNWSVRLDLSLRLRLLGAAWPWRLGS